jgi:hypothetical protein
MNPRKQKKGSDRPPGVINVDPGTLLFLIVILLLVPLIVAGFWD